MPGYKTVRSGQVRQAGWRRPPACLTWGRELEPGHPPASADAASHQAPLLFRSQRCGTAMARAESSSEQPAQRRWPCHSRRCLPRAGRHAASGPPLTTPRPPPSPAQGTGARVRLSHVAAVSPRLPGGPERVPENQAPRRPHRAPRRPLPGVSRPSPLPVHRVLQGHQPHQPRGGCCRRPWGDGTCAGPGRPTFCRRAPAPSQVMVVYRPSPSYMPKGDEEGGRAAQGYTAKVRRPWGGGCGAAVLTLLPGPTLA